MPSKWSFYKAHCDFLAVVDWIICIKEKKKLRYQFVFICAIYLGQVVLFLVFTMQYKPKIFLAVRSSPPFLLSTQSVIISLWYFALFNVIVRFLGQKSLVSVVLVLK
jgi:hypothetical protein